MKKFSRDAWSLSKETNLTMSEVLKCFDAIPILYNEYNSEIPPVISGTPVDNSDVDTIKYIGGYIVRRCLKKRSTSDIEKKVSAPVGCTQHGILTLRNSGTFG